MLRKYSVSKFQSACRLCGHGIYDMGKQLVQKQCILHRAESSKQSSVVIKIIAQWKISKVFIIRNFQYYKNFISESINLTIDILRSESFNL